MLELELNQAKCTTTKLPGNIYYYYLDRKSRNSVQKNTFLSILSPDVWGPHGCPYDLIGGKNFSFNLIFQALNQIKIMFFF
jgi:hypothetical protein